MAFKPIEILINAKDNASAVFGSLQAKAAAVGAAIATYFGINAFAGIVSGAADLETAMSRVQAATGATGEEMQALRKAAEDAGANTKFTSTEAAGALENLAKAGLSATDSIAALPAVLNLAQAGDIGLAESSELVTKAVMGMGLAFTDAGRVADVLALGANATNTSVQGLAQALSYAAPVAQSLGLSLESTVAIIGKFADAGIDASRAGTALNSILSQFSNPASKFREELAAAGITTGNFETALHQLAAAGPAGSKAINAVGQEAGPALRALLNQGMGALDGLTEKLKTAEGSAAATAAVMQNNLNGALSGLSSAWDTVKNALGTPVLPVLQQGVEQLAGAFRAAVADGTVAKFGEAISTAFQAGIKWVREFLGTVDFTAVLARMQAFADSTNETFTKVGEYATNAGATVQIAVGVVQTSFATLMVTAGGVANALVLMVQAGLKGLELLYRASEKITFGKVAEQYKAMADGFKMQAEAMGAASDAVSLQIRQSLENIGKGMTNVQEGFGGLKTTVEQTAPAATAAAAAFDDMGKRLEEVRQKSSQAQKATEDKAAADRAAGDAIRKLRAEYADLVASGSIQAAAEKLQEINKALQGTPPAAAAAGKAAQEAAAAIAAAYKDLGVTTDADLKKVADRAKANFDLLAKSGTASARELSDGFVDAAQKAIAANNGIAPSWVTAQAGVRGFKLEADDAGKVVLRSMTEAAQATTAVGRAAAGTVGGFRAMGQSAEQAAAQLKKLNDIYDKHRLDKNKDPDRIGKSGDLREAAVMETDVNQEIARRYGEEFIDNDLAKKAFNLRLQLESYQRNYGNTRSKQSWDQQRNIGAELDRVERLIEAERNKTDGNANPGAATRPATPSRPQDTSSNGTIRSPSGGAGVAQPAGQGGISITINANGISDPARLAKLLEPELKRIAARSR